MSDRCYYHFDRDVGRILIPGCMGAAVYGKDGCTCPTPPMREKTVKTIEQRLTDIERVLAAICEHLEVKPSSASRNAGDKSEAKGLAPPAEHGADDRIHEGAD